MRRLVLSAKYQTHNCDGARILRSGRHLYHRT